MYKLGVGFDLENWRCRIGSTIPTHRITSRREGGIEGENRFLEMVFKVAGPS